MSVSLCIRVSGLLALLCAPLLTAHAAQHNLVARQSNLAQVARAIPRGESLRVSDVHLENAGTVALDLERFRVFADDAQIVLGANATMSAPKDAYFRGKVAGQPDSTVVVGISEAGKLRGVINDNRGGQWSISSEEGPHQAGMVARRAKPMDANDTSWQRSALEAPETANGFSAASPNVMSQVAAMAATDVDTNKYLARLAVETDYELYARFNDTNAALTYVGDMVAYVSSVLEREVGIGLELSWVRLWPDGVDSDPWSSGISVSSLRNELTTYWVDHMQHVQRSMVHLFSGRAYGGVTVYGGLCTPDAGYSVTSSGATTAEDLRPITLDPAAYLV